MSDNPNFVTYILITISILLFVALAVLYINLDSVWLALISSGEPDNHYVPKVYEVVRYCNVPDSLK